MKRNIKYYLIAFSFIMLNAEIYSQNAYVSGFVNAANSEDPLIGATVYYTSGQGTTTNYNGFYELSIPAGTYELLASYVGYEDFEQTIELKAGDSIKLDLTLQFEPSILNTVTVTSGRSETLLSEATVSLEVIKPNLIESTNKLSLDKAVEKIPGVSVVDGQANIRGGSGYSFGAGSRVLLLQDDVPVLQLDAAFPNWYDLPIEHTDQIEVLKGAASSLYGSAAMNGIIHFRTAFATSEPITKVSLSHNIIGNPKDAAEGEQWWDDAPYTFAASLSHRQKFGKYDLVAGGYYFNEQSHIHDVYRKFGRISVRNRYRFSDRFTAQLNVNIATGVNNVYFFWRGEEDKYRGFPGTDSRSDYTRIYIDPILTYFDQSGNRHQLITKYINFNNEVSNGRSNTSDQYYMSYQFQRKFSKINATLTTGLVVSGANGDSDLYGDTTINARNLGAFIQFDKKVGEKLNLSGGFRYESNTIINPGFELPFIQVDPSEEEEAKPVFRFGANYQLMDYTFLRASWGQAYRFPSIAEKFIFTDVGGFSVVPNPELQSETGWSLELGLKQGLKLGSWEGFLDIAAFRTRYSDMMEFNFLLIEDFDEIGFQSLNIGDTNIDGLDISLTARGKILGLESQLLAGLLFIDPRFLEFDNRGIQPGESGTIAQINSNNSSSDDNILKYRSRQSAKIDAQLTYKSFTLGGAFFYNSHQEAIDAIFNLIIPGIQDFRSANNTGNRLLNLRASYQISEEIKFSTFVNNVFNTTYINRPGLIEAPISYGVRLDGTF